MDWETHILLSVKLLEACQLDKGAAIYSLLPVIDIKPPHFHRVYAHILENLPPLLEAGFKVFTSQEAREGSLEDLKKKVGKMVEKFQKALGPSVSSKKRQELERSIYLYTRVGDEAPTFLELAHKAAQALQEPKICQISQDKTSACLSLLSHVYFDPFNNPVQAFLPESSICSAQWTFWDKIDYMRFRGAFYNGDNIALFRQQIAESPLWQRKLNPISLAKAMIIRLGEQGQPALDYETIDWGVRRFLRYMGIDQYQRAVEELEFCHLMEDEISNLIQSKFGK